MSTQVDLTTTIEGCEDTVYLTKQNRLCNKCERAAFAGKYSLLRSKINTHVQYAYVPSVGTHVCVFLVPLLVGHPVVRSRLTMSGKGQMPNIDSAAVHSSRVRARVLLLRVNI